MLTMGMNSATTSRTSVIGRLVRRTRLDEVPRFYNVLIGDMSLIGPRPLLPQDLPEQPSNVSTATRWEDHVPVGR
jgi:lipopolysaccharide/colanic/teichoic acid biosynthesis glycosyltransferase